MQDCADTAYEEIESAPSESTASAVRPTVAPFAAFSATVLAPLSESEGSPTGFSLTSVTATEKVVSAVLVSWLVALTVIVQV